MMNLKITEEDSKILKCSATEAYAFGKIHKNSVCLGFVNQKKKIRAFILET